MNIFKKQEIIELIPATSQNKKIVWLSDTALITGDALVAFLAQDWFYNNFLITAGPSASPVTSQLMCGGLMIMLGLYAYALFSNIENITNLPKRPSGNSEWGALAFNTILVSVIIALTLMGLFRAESMVMTIISVFVVMGLWYWLHYSVFTAAAKGGEGPVIKAKQTRGIIMVMPVALVCMMPTTAIATSFKEVLVTLTLTDIIWQTVVFSILLTTLTWMLTYIPRRMISIISGSTYRNPYFFLLLLVETIFKVIF